MIITVAQISSDAGRIKENLQKIKETVTEAPDGALVVFPELALTGNVTGETAISKTVTESVTRAVKNLEQYTAQNNKSILIGTMYTPNQKWAPHNIAMLITNGKSTTVTSNESDTNGSFILNNKTFSVILGSSVSENFYEKNIQSAYMSDFIIVIANRKYTPISESYMWRKLLTLNSSTYNKNIIFVNSVGAHDGKVFYGKSYAHMNLREIALLPYFEEIVESFDTESTKNVEPEDTDRSSVSLQYEAAVIGLREYMKNNGMTKVAVGASGGIDSALVLTMAADAIGGENVLGIAMPSKYSSEHSLTDAESLLKNLGGEYRVIPIQDMVNAFQMSLSLTGVAEENLQARVRGIVLMGVSNSEGYLVLAPGNKSELAVGYSTIYGDAVGGYAPIKDLYKTEVYELSEYRNSLPDSPIPVSTITKPPSAELSPDQLDTDSLPNYDILDKFLKSFLELGHEERSGDKNLVGEFGEELTSDILKKVYRSEWKRAQYPIGTQLSVLSFDEREVPITR